MKVCLTKHVKQLDEWMGFHVENETLHQYGIEELSRKQLSLRNLTENPNGIHPKDRLFFEELGRIFVVHSV